MSRGLTGLLLALAVVACRRSEDRTGAAAGESRRPPPSWVAVQLDLRDHDDGAVEQAADAIEATVMRVPDLAVVRTEITDPRLVTWLAFDVDDATSAASAVRDVLTSAQNTLPAGAHPEVVRHDRGYADAWILLRSPDVTIDALTELADGLRSELLHRPGVVEVRACGPRRRTVLALDDTRLGAAGLTAGQVLALLQQEVPTLARSSIDVDELRTRTYAGVPGDMFMTIGAERTGPCRVLTGNRGNGVALHVRYRADADRKAALAGVLAQTSAQLPPGVALQHEALADRPDTFAPRVHARAPEGAAFPDALAEGGDGSWVVVDDALGSAQLVGLADAETARHTAAQWAKTPGITAVVQDSRWSTVAIACQDPARLRELAPRLAALLAQGGKLSVWPEQGHAAERLDVAIDRAAAARVGVGVHEIRETIALYGEGVVIGARKDAPSVDVVVRVGPQPSAEPAWSAARVHARDGAVPLPSLVSVREARPAHGQRCSGLPCVGFAIPAVVAAELDLPAMSRDLALTPAEPLLLLPRPP